MRSGRMLVVVAMAACSGAPPAQPQSNTFAGLFAHLSEPSGFFDTDNLISNERSYLHVVEELDSARVLGGAFIGVGPDQSFSYIAAIRADVAYILDIRRANALEHLIFKALFALAPTRIEYLSALFGRAPPARATDWETYGIELLIAHLDSASADHRFIDDLRRRVDSVITTFDVPLSDEDWATIDRFHRTFIADGLDLQFQSFGRAPRYYYPTYRDLLLERTKDGRRSNFLASRNSYSHLHDLQARDLVIPVVGNFAGAHALQAIAVDIAQRGLTVSAFYASNVEFYLYRDGSMNAFVDNLAALPLNESSVMIRSLFLSSYPYQHPEAVDGYPSVQLLQPIRRMVDGYRDGGFRSYTRLIADKEGS